MKVRIKYKKIIVKRARHVKFSSGIIANLPAYQLGDYWKKLERELKKV